MHKISASPIFTGFLDLCNYAKLNFQHCKFKKNHDKRRPFSTGFTSTRRINEYDIFFENVLQSE